MQQITSSSLSLEKVATMNTHDAYDSIGPLKQVLLCFKSPMSKKTSREDASLLHNGKRLSHFTPCVEDGKAKKRKTAKSNAVGEMQVAPVKSYHPDSVPSSPDANTNCQKGLLQEDHLDVFSENSLISSPSSGAQISIKPVIPPENTYETSMEYVLFSFFSESARVGQVSDQKWYQTDMKTFAHMWIETKALGESILSQKEKGVERDKQLAAWRIACERSYKLAARIHSSNDKEDAATIVMTDSRCGEHRTESGSFERSVRLPAAIHGAKKAGAGIVKQLQLVDSVQRSYLSLAENKILPLAHHKSYLNSLKRKIESFPVNATGEPLTDDSDGEEGGDTTGSRGSFSAAMAGVGSALQAVDMVMSGKCINAFCAIRPPGHHAGKRKRPMKAVSNGFCVLNNAASAAIFAATPSEDGGLGLSRVCVIDIDVHHGNGTQDILCSKFDPRFLYVSLHAGYDPKKGKDRSPATGDGVYPGKSGETSPHPGVLNIPLGKMVMPRAIKKAMIEQVSPAVETFSPELIILSAGFDAHKNDPLGLGGLSAKDFGRVTDIACQIANKCCSGRLVSVLEGGYGVPCCRPKSDLFLPRRSRRANDDIELHFQLGDDLPSDMDDNIPPDLEKILGRCHREGFVECVQEHVASLFRMSKITRG